VVSTLFQDRLDPVLLAEILLAHVVDFQASGVRQFLGICFDGLGQRLGELSKVENPDTPLRQLRGHPLGVAEHRQGSLHDHSVIAGQHPSDLLGMPLGQHCQAHHPPPWADHTQIALLFGSGYAGLGSGCANNYEKGVQTPATALCPVRLGISN
jgi:hypothetical protein